MSDEELIEAIRKHLGDSDFALWAIRMIEATAEHYSSNPVPAPFGSGDVIEPLACECEACITRYQIEDVVAAFVKRCSECGGTRVRTILHEEHHDECSGDCSASSCPVPRETIARCESCAPRDGVSP